MPPIVVATSAALPTSVCTRMYACTATVASRWPHGRSHPRRRARMSDHATRTEAIPITGTPGSTGTPARGSVGELGEFALISAITARLEQGAHVELGPGDDAAVVRIGGGRVVATTDVLVEGNHFRRDWSTALDIGHKAAAQNLADVAAMGARPTTLLVGLALPPDVEVAWVTALADGLAEECALVGASVAGGDIVRSNVVTISVTALGELVGDEP